jgi:hypothetical protein
MRNNKFEEEVALTPVKVGEFRAKLASGEAKLLTCRNCYGTKIHHYPNGQRSLELFCDYCK